MLIKLLQRSGISSTFSCLKIKYRQSTGNQQKIQLQRMRNRDYESERGKLVEQYNQQLRIEREQYANTITQLKKFRQQTKYSKDFLYQADNQVDRAVDTYRSKINNLSKLFNEKVSKIDDQQKTNTVKLYLTDHLKDQEPVVNSTQKNASYQTGGFYIPNRFILKKLYLCSQKQSKEAKAGKQLLLAGVESEEEHCLFLNKVFEQFKIKNVVTMIPPDLPFFLKTQGSFIEEWERFLSDSNYARKVKFYVNPKPKTLDQIALHSHYSPFVRSSLARSKSFLDTHYYLMQENQLSRKFQPVPLLTGICNQSVEKIYMADYPIFQQRKMLADSIPLGKLRELFQLHLKNIRENRLNFSAQWLFPKQVLKKKLSHLLGVARAVTEKGEGRTMLICPAEIAELIAIQWQMSKKQDFLSYNYNDGRHYLNLGQHEEKEGQQAFIQFVEKLVILDVIMERPVITNYFVKYQSFPFLCHHTIGGRQNIGKIFIVWMHFYKTYYQILTEKRLLTGQQEIKRAQYFSKFEHPNDFHT